MYLFNHNSSGQLFYSFHSIQVSRGTQPKELQIERENWLFDLEGHC